MASRNHEYYKKTLKPERDDKELSTYENKDQKGQDANSCSQNRECGAGKEMGMDNNEVIALIAQTFSMCRS